MPKFSSHSLAALKTCDPALREILTQAIREIDFSVLWGYRGEADQNYAYDNGFSQLKFPKSKHNSTPSRAVDIAPYPINWADPVRFCELAKVIKRIANELMIEVVWGGDWSRFVDMAHWELVEPWHRDHAEGA
jgi:hypothetical protein